MTRKLITKAGELAFTFAASSAGMAFGRCIYESGKALWNVAIGSIETFQEEGASNE